MTDFDVQLIDGRRTTVHIPPRLTFKQPGPRTLAELEMAIAAGVTQSVAPHLYPRLAEKRVVRDAVGLIDKIILVPAASVAEQAASVGTEVARRYMEGVEE